MVRMKIEDAIKDAGLKNKYVASCLGISETYFKTYISNSSKISIQHALKICELTGKKMNELDFGQGDDF